MFKINKYLAPIFLAFACAGLAAADGHKEQAAEVAATEAKAEMEAEARVETNVETIVKKETSGEANESAAAGEAAASSEAKTSFEEKVTAYNEEQADDDKVICRRVKKTGTRLASRRCVTRKQAKREREDAQEALQRAQRGSNSGPIN